MNKNYEKYAAIQKISAERLFEIVKDLDVKSVLDIGAGTGFLSKHFKNYVALDVDKSLKTYHRRFVLGEAENLPFKDKSFDMVLSNFVMHLCNTELSIREKVRVSKRYVACSLPIEGSLEGWIYHFPEEKQVLELLRGYKLKIFEKSVYPVNFTKLELLRFINITGKPKIRYKNNFISKSYIKDILVKIENPKFVVLSFLLEV